MGSPILDSIIFVLILLDDSDDLLPLDESMIISSASDGFGCLVGTDLHEWHIRRARDECSDERRSEITVCAVASTVRAFCRVSSSWTPRWNYHYYSPSSPPGAGERPEAF